MTAACLGWSALALAQPYTTTFTEFKGGPVPAAEGVNASGKWIRTITDLNMPNGPDGEKVLAVHTLEVSWTSLMTADDIAEAYRAECTAKLPAAVYGTHKPNLVPPTIRLSIQPGFGSYNISDSPPPNSYPPNITVNTFPPSNAEHAPITSPAVLASLVATLSALAYWARRRSQRA